MIKNFPTIFKIIFRAGFGHYSRTFSRFPSNWKIWALGEMAFRRSSPLSGNPF